MYLSNKLLISFVISFFLFLNIYKTVSSTELTELQALVKAQQEANKIEEQSKDQYKTVDAITAGKLEYERTCSICHGVNAKGDGVYAVSLAVEPSDLTQAQKNHQGVFPFLKMYRVIDGQEDIQHHGPRIMPIWGDRFASQSWLDVPRKDVDTIVRGRIFEIILYLHTIQEK